MAEFRCVTHVNHQLFRDNVLNSSGSPFQSHVSSKQSEYCSI